MSVLSGEKRKNDEPRRFQWWLLVIGFALGILLSLVVMQSRSSGTVVYLPDNANLEGIELTATEIIRQATIEAHLARSVYVRGVTPLRPDFCFCTVGLLLLLLHRAQPKWLRVVSSSSSATGVFVADVMRYEC